MSKKPIAEGARATAPLSEATPRARAKYLVRAQPYVASPPDLVPARMINEVLYCERLLYLEWSQGEFEDNVFTVDGRTVHKRADVVSGALPPKPEGNKKEAEEEEEGAEALPYTARSVWLSSAKLGITAKIDVVDGDEDGRVVPIEYKRGKAPDLPEGAYLPERAQVCAQVLLLREAGYVCEGGAIYFAETRRRVPIVIDEALIQTTLGAAARAKELATRGELPPPLTDSPKCYGCSLVGICLPDEVTLLRRLSGEDVDAEPEPPAPEAAPWEDDPAPGGPDPWGLRPEEGAEPAVELRRIHPARDDRIPLYVQEQGARVTLDGERLVVIPRKGGRVEARLSNTSHVALLGNIQITTQAIRTLIDRDVPVGFFTSGGWFLGRTVGHGSKNIELRIAQHRAAADPAVCLGVARRIVASKIRNGRTMLRRNHDEAPAVVLGQLEQLAKKAEAAEALEQLLGLEGTAARVYFEAFGGMLRGAAAEAGTFDLEGRNRRPPADPVNALLSFSYSLLAKDYALAIAHVGLDPLLGFYHQPRFGRPALALDLMEELRPIVADSTVVGAINTAVIGADDFLRHGDAVSLLPEARKRFIAAYERRMDQLVTHPLFGYRLSYRRLLEVQARLVGRLVLGEIPEYPIFRTR